MTSILFDRKPKPQGPDPILVAFYSIIPGFGQFYNGKNKKGILFLSATFISILMLLGSIFPQHTLPFAVFIFSALKFITKFDFKPSPAADMIMKSISYGGSFSTLLSFFILGFILYSMTDAYLDAERARQTFDRRIILTDSTNFRFSESTIGSYILHATFFIFIFLLSLFFVIPTQKKEQVTEIEFIIPQIESRQPPPKDTKRRSSVQSIDQGKHDPNKPITAVQKAQPPAVPTHMIAVPAAAPKKVEAQKTVTPPKPVEPPKPIEPPKAIVPPMPKALPKPIPKINSQEEGLEKAPQNIAPIKPVIGSMSTGLPQPEPAPQAPSQGTGNAPGSVSGIAVIPKLVGGGGYAGSLGNLGNPPPNSNPNGPNSLAALKDIDFGAYMNELQRRIKRAWRPPRGNESKRVIVIFKLNSVGALSDLALKVSSGSKIADEAALLAVRTAAPFNPLPNGAPPSVDIEFTFDYNVFGDRGYYMGY